MTAPGPGDALSSLDGLDAFALLGPGFSDDGRWRLLRPAPDGDATLWLAPYASHPTPSRATQTPFSPRLETAPPIPFSLDDSGFLDGVDAIRQRIAAGDVYQVNLTVRASLPNVPGSALLARLCARGVPRFAAWVRWPGTPEFVSASPELLVETRGRWIHAEPMKGTAPKGHAERLLGSPKDAAELAMITDLTRDDLHRLCTPRSVRVTAPRRLVELPYALQAVSDVEGTLRDDVATADVLRVMHPGGSVTGAPRPAAMAVIAELEVSPRQLYCGTLGLESDAHLRAALLIRSATRSHDGWAYGVGCGITWDSNPHAELDELRLKLGALG
ncbi:MAG: chorismate-binding protein [Myxococcaceae bacterium]|nr:chorismate-binding protein [Myxococcaceae bacterium]MCA3010972.1 chorismate-binding protein [Myxococcaceae bacterium]